MQLKSITANNFKSLVDFKIDLAKFTCLIGLNGSGKSTVLQLIDFLAQQVRGDLKGWLEERRWRSRDLRSHLSAASTIDFDVVLTAEDFRWKARFDPEFLFCTSESITTPEFFLRVEGGRLRIVSRRECDSDDPVVHDESISFDYEGSILSKFKESVFLNLGNGGFEESNSLIEFKYAIRGIRPLDLLAPGNLRRRSRQSGGSIGLGGREFAAHIHNIGDDGRNALLKKLKDVYPRLDGLESKALKSGWRQLEIKESFEGKRIVTEARHVNDGMLRLMAVLAEVQSKDSILLFDEIENGINPEVVEFLIEELTSARQQLIVTTHSPMILNYLRDEQAREGVVYLDKTPEGATRAIPFFSIPSLAKKLEVMGPGEAFVDTDLTRVAEEINSVSIEG